jgi:hypothetical protein
MEATVTIKATPRDFDLIRRALNSAIEVEEGLQQNMKDENTDEKGTVRVAHVPEYRESIGRVAEYSLLLERLQ